MSYLASRLRQEGLTVQAQMGVGPHRVELAVGHPSVADRWLVAVESDGPGYAALPGVRARDVLRPRQLRRLGWEPIRVWSTDLYRDPAPEVVRVVAAVTATLRARNAQVAAAEALGPKAPEPAAEPGASGPAAATSTTVGSRNSALRTGSDPAGMPLGPAQPSRPVAIEVAALAANVTRTSRRNSAASIRRETRCPTHQPRSIAGAP